MKNRYLFLFTIAFFLNVYSQTTSYDNLFVSDLGLFTYNYDGSKNNLAHNYGLAGSFYDVKLTGLEPYPWQHITVMNPLPAYKDIDLLPPEGPRPNARDISNELFLHFNESESSPNRESMFTTAFAQFINHDIERNAKMDPDNMSTFLMPTYFRNISDYACLETEEFPRPHPFRCGPEDPVIVAQIKQSKGEFDGDGNFNTYNEVTSFFDLSQVYGSERSIGINIRSKIGGKLLMRNNVTFTIPTESPTIPPYEYTFNDMLPDYPTTGAPVEQIYHEYGEQDSFFTAGDERVNENLGLSLLHTVFAREHNKICDEIMESNLLFKTYPEMFDDVIFTLARSINVHQYQKIIYEEYFREAYGDYFYNLLGEYESYNPNVDPTTSLVFSSAAFRYGHFMMKSYHALDKCGNAMMGGRQSPNQNFKQLLLGFQNPSPIMYNPYARFANAGGYENVLRGLIHETSAPNKLGLEHFMRNLTNPDSILDLGVYDIIRARYNHVPNYQKIRKIFFKSGDSDIDNIYGAEGCPDFLENSSENDDPLECFLHITKDTSFAIKLKKLYKKVNLIDAIIGIQAEDKVIGSSMGRTGGHIIVDEFKRTRDGDRFFYGSQELVSKFSPMTVKLNSLKEIITRNLGPDLDLPDNLYKSPENYRQYLIESCQND